MTWTIAYYSKGRFNPEWIEGLTFSQKYRLSNWLADVTKKENDDFHEQLNLLKKSNK